MEISIKGIDQVLQNIDRLPERITKNAFARSLAAAAVPIVEALVAETPVHTGDLKSHVKTQIEIDSHGKGGRVRIGFGKEGYVARMVELGHREIGHAPEHKELGNVAAKPFMRAALEMSAGEAIEVFNATMISSLTDGGF